MLTVRDCTMARIASMRWMLDMGRNIPKIWDAGFRDEAIDMAETYNDVRDVVLKLWDIRKGIENEVSAKEGTLGDALASASTVPADVHKE